MFFVNSLGLSVSWILPLLEDRIYPSSYALYRELWFRKCNIYTISKVRKIYSVQSAKLQKAYDLIPEFDIDGRSHTLSTKVDRLVPVRFKPGDRVFVYTGRHRGEGYGGIIWLAWVENYRRRYLIKLESRSRSQK